MADQPELLGGNQNDQASQPSAANQNNQLVQLSADKNKKKKKREADKKFRDGKKQKIEDMLKQNEKLKADNAGLEKKLAYANGQLDQLKEHMEKDKENVRTLQVNMDKQCNEINKQLRQLLQLPFEMTEFGTGATGLPVHHPPVYQSGDWAIAESLGLPQSHVPQGLTHGNNVEQPALTYDGDLFVSLNHLNNTYPPRTALPWWSSSPMQGPLAPQGQGNNSEQPASADDDQFPNIH